MYPLHLTIQFQRYECFSALLKHKLVSVVPTILMKISIVWPAFAICFGLRFRAQQMRPNAYQIRLDVPDSTGKTPLHIAAGQT